MSFNSSLDNNKNNNKAAVPENSAPDIVLNSSQALIYLTLAAALRGPCYPHFIGQEAQLQEGAATSRITQRE